MLLHLLSLITLRRLCHYPQRIISVLGQLQKLWLHSVNSYAHSLGSSIYTYKLHPAAAELSLTGLQDWCDLLDESGGLFQDARECHHFRYLSPGCPSWLAFFLLWSVRELCTHEIGCGALRGDRCVDLFHGGGVVSLPLLLVYCRGCSGTWDRGECGGGEEEKRERRGEGGGQL